MKKLWLIAFVMLIALSSAKIPNTSENVEYLSTRNEDGSAKTLDQVLEANKGKVIYVDFWASWCGPCRRQMGYSKKLHKQFDGQDVVFLYVALNDKEKPWKNAVDKIQASGQHFMPELKEAKKISQQYNILGVPHFMLVDKSGKVVNSNAPKPSSTQAAKQIKNLL